MFWLLIIFIIFLILYLHFINIKGLNKDFTIKKSKIHNFGLFANKDFKKNDIMIKDLFPYVNKNKSIENNFNEVIIKEGRYINHCKNNANSDVKMKNNKYKVICKKNIKNGEEIYSDYDKIHNKYSVIGGSKSYYKNC